MEEDGASQEIISKVRKGGKKYEVVGENELLLYVECFRKRVGPKSVLRKLGIECQSDNDARDSSTSEDEAPDTILRLPNRMKFR